MSLSLEKELSLDVDEYRAALRDLSEACEQMNDALNRLDDASITVNANETDD